jgi:hypothetical protein
LTLATSDNTFLLLITPLRCFPMELTISSWVWPVRVESFANCAASSTVNPKFLVSLRLSSNVFAEKSAEVEVEGGA